MDLGSHLANLSLAEIASMLNTKQQEVLLASISVAARFIQQLQAEEQIQAEEQERRSAEVSTECEQDDEFEDEFEDDDDLDDDDEYSDNPQHADRRRHSAPAHPHLSKPHPHQHPRHQHPSHDLTDAESQTLLTIREFADELKSRRKAIRLSQKGAAQSLRAFTAGEQPCTDAIIYHFENLQLEPDRAMQLIPLLRNWLEWAEKHRLNGKQLPMMCAVTKVPRERKRKVVLFNEKAKQYLEDAFLKNNHPDRYQLDVISQELSIPTRSIRKWFTNRRQRKRFAEKFSL